jgi:hypothetical protein
VTAAQIYLPDTAYPAPAVPPAAPAVDAGTSRTPAPYTTAEADGAISTALAQQMREWQAQNQQFFNDTFPADIAVAAPLPDLGGIGTLLLLGLAGLVVGLVVVKKL